MLWGEALEECQNEVEYNGSFEKGMLIINEDAMDVHPLIEKGYANTIIHIIMDLFVYFICACIQVYFHCGV